jgi:hypothetical protein
MHFSWDLSLILHGTISKAEIRLFLTAAFLQFLQISCLNLNSIIPTVSSS